MPSHVPGELLRVRGSLWRLRSQTANETCTELELDPVADAAGEAPCVLLEPFDRPERLPRDRPPRVVTRRAWMRSLLDELVEAHGGDVLVAPVSADIAILPYQLEPALAMVIGGSPRVLLADGVGLGKTIQAALVLAELRARRMLRRALVLTPPGLRDQWCQELHDRFGFDPVVADAPLLRTMRAELPVSVNPWSVPLLAVASIDFVKRPDVRGGLADLFWDIVIVDEAHAASADSERRAAAHDVARRARHVLLLTATPHAGDASAFDALCRIGALGADEPVALIRRTRSDAGYSIRRHVHLLPIHLTEVERELHERLTAYASRIWRERARDACNDVRLAAIVLLKRACSSMTSLAESLAFRLAHLGDPAGALVAQLGLPFDEESDPADDIPIVALAAPGFDDVREERGVLESLVELARAAAATDSKLRAIARFLRRVPEPCIVFTEYRDTLAAVERELAGCVSTVTLHGGLDRASRSDSLRRFSSGAGRVLLATDAGGEGLNLQAACRIVINLELPWNPVRLEQRIGRVDRIGQTRTVHAINLVAAGTHEANVLARLVYRLGCIRGSLGSFDEVLGPEGERAVAEVLMGAPVSSLLRMHEPGKLLATAAVSTASPAIEIRRQHAHLLAQRVIWSVREQRRSSERHRPGLASHAKCVTRITAIPLRRLCARTARGPVFCYPVGSMNGCAAGRFPGTGVLAICRTTIVDRSGRLVDETFVPLFMPAPVRSVRRRREVLDLAQEWLAVAGHRFTTDAQACATNRLATIRGLYRTRLANGRERMFALRQHAEDSRGLIQSGLFDRRTEREAAEQQRDLRSASIEIIQTPATGDLVLSGPPELAFVLLVTREDERNG